ncbi:resuscitation-promoting factor [Actinomyces vulturis]|uniref:resuscitation-promoting factor n=1 Tax=Actinomyces vulturis TaxID=1857645 RepID=UPI00159EF0E3|nr:resuscitation-promoting factor [Actinomyces vulturis]
MSDNLSVNPNTAAPQEHHDEEAKTKPALLSWLATHKVLSVIVAVLLVAGISGTGWAIDQYHSVTVTVDGKPTEVSLLGGTVDSALNKANLKISDYDVVTPTRDQKLRDGMTITVMRAHGIPGIVNGKQVTFYTAADTIDGALDDLAEQNPGTTVAMIPSRDTTSENYMPLMKSGIVTVTADGTTTSVTVDHEMSVDDVLAAAKLTASETDKLLASKPAAGTMTLAITRITRQTVTSTEPIAHETEKRDDDTLALGTTEVIQAGEDGVTTTTTYVETTDGKTTFSKVLSSETTKEPVKEIIAVGTKEEPQPEQIQASGQQKTQSSESGSAPAATHSSVDNSDVWAAIAQCESGGNPATNTGNGYYGMYQFALSTWQAYGGQGLPSEASAAEQLRVAKLVQQGQGWGAWGACAARAGVY